MNKNVAVQLWRDHRGFLVFLALMFVFRSAFADWNTVPSGSMQPTIVEGDRILINKMAYDIRIPFTLHSMVKLADPQRGDIVVFESAIAKKRLVKRVIGLPGETIALNDNQLFINSEKIDYADLTTHDHFRDVLEDLTDKKHLVRLQHQPSPLANFGAVTVPADSYLVLGDSRDNSADSRVIGFVPRQEIIGRAQQVVLSLNYDNYYLPRQDRFFKPL